MEERRYYHYVFSTYKRKYVLNDESICYIRRCFYDIAKAKMIEIISLKILRDHVHMLIEQKLNDPPAFIMKCIKGSSSHKFFKQYPQIDRVIFRKLWSRSYYCREISNDELEIVTKYIKNQTNTLGKDKRFI